MEILTDVMKVEILNYFRARRERQSPMKSKLSK